MSLLTKNLDAVNKFTFEIADTFFQMKGRLLKQKEKGYKYFAEGFIHDVWVCTVINNEFCVKAKCFKSQKKNDKPHDLNIEFVSENLQIKGCRCTCEAGASESCQHLIALAYTLQHLILKGFHEIPEDLSCTSIAQQWNVPRGQKINPEPIMNVAFVNAVNINRQKNPVLCDLYDARTQNMKSISSAEIESCKSKLAEVDSRIPFAYLLTSAATEAQNSYEGITKDPAIFYHLKDYRLPSVQCEVDHNVLKLKFPIITAETQKILTTTVFKLPDTIKKTIDECYAIEELSRDQAFSTVWKSEKQFRFTASNFGLISKRKKAPSEKFISSLLECKDISHLPAIKHGRNNEEVARLKYTREKQSVQVYRCGLVINPLASYLGASPDGHVVDSALEENVNGVLEIKCPYSTKFRSVEDAVKCKDFFCEQINNNIKLKQTSNYFYQVQGQMLMCGVNWCDFVVYFTKTDEIIIERIKFDFDFCLRMFDKLSVMYCSYVIPFMSKENKENKV